MSNDAHLAQGTYIICGAVPTALGSDKTLTMSNTLQDSLVITDEAVFRWDVLHPWDYTKPNQFTIEMHDEDDAYAACRQDRRVHLGHNAQVYDIVFVREDIYRWIRIRGTNMALKWHGSRQPVTVTIAHNHPSVEWRFCKANDPFVAYGEFFEQDMRPNWNLTKVFPHFGLLPLGSNSNTRWNDFWRKIDNLNQTGSKEKIFYKVFFLGRHGQAVHNLRSTQDVDTGPDPELTQQGLLDAAYVHTVWVKEQAEANIGLPQISYCSPFSRCLTTNTITFGVEAYGSDPPKLSTLVVENCRELYCDDRLRQGQRRSKDYIADMFRKFSSDGLIPGPDPFWPRIESMKELRGRVRKVLDTIFVDENEDKQFVSITTHGSFMAAFLRVVGRGPYMVPNGCVLPLVIQYTRN